MHYKLDSISINVPHRELKVGSQVVHVEPQVFDLLIYLLKNRHQVVSRDDLFEHVWQTRFVSDSVVSSRITQLRKALGDNGRDQRVIRTIHGKGYRIVGRVLETQVEPSLCESDSQVRTGRGVTTAEYSNLPRQRKELVGRQPELERTLEALSHSSLVTVVGPGGVGKTALAIEVGRRSANFQSVVMCELASTTHQTVPDAVIGSIDGSAGNHEATAAQIIDCMDDGSVLLILDNCEHVIESVIKLCESLLDGKSDLTILATSRESFGLDFEQVIRLNGLDATNLNGDAVVLFKERAASCTDVNISDRDLPLVLRIVQQLDGLPLAIELATSRLLVFSLSELSDALEDSIALLKKKRGPSARQLTMERTIAWSFELLSAEEKNTLVELSVFKGQFSLDAVNAVVSSGDADSILHRLVDQSVVARHVIGSGTSFRLLEPIRQFIACRLTGERRRLVSDRYAAYYLDRVHIIAMGLRSEQEVSHATALTREWRDIGASILWSQENGKCTEAIRAILDLGLHLLFQHRFEAFDWLETLVADSDSDIILASQTIALRALGIAFCQRDLDSAEQLLIDGGDKRDASLEIAFSWFFVLIVKGDFDTLVPHCDDLCKLTRRTENEQWRIVAESMRLGAYAMVDPHSTEVDSMLDTVKFLETRSRWPLGLIWALLDQYVVAVGRQETELADGLLKKITRRSREWQLSWFATTAGALPRQPSNPVKHLSVIVSTMRSALEMNDLMQMPAILRTLFVTLVLCDRMESATKLYSLIPKIKGFGDSGSDSLGFDDACETLYSSVPPEEFRSLSDIGVDMTLSQVLFMAEEELASLHHGGSVDSSKSAR